MPAGFAPLYPVNKFFNFGVFQQFFDGIVVAFELFFAQHGMDLVVTNTADHQNAMADLLSSELLFIAFFPVSRAWNEVVFG